MVRTEAMNSLTHSFTKKIVRIYGAGMTTKLEFIEDSLAQRGMGFIRSHEPGGRPLGESKRGLLLGASVEVGMARARQRGSADRFQAEIRAVFARVWRALDRAGWFPVRIKRVDAAQTLDRARADLARRLDGLPGG